MKKNVLISFIVGFLFALGLGISGMTNPEKVIGFLDVTGDWDPSLLFVMVGSIVVHFGAYRLMNKRRKPLFDTKWHVPTKKELTPALVIGSALFGMGWGLAGYCPGPALVSLTGLYWRVLLFALSMLTGMILFRALDARFHFKK